MNIFVFGQVPVAKIIQKKNGIEVRRLDLCQFLFFFDANSKKNIDFRKVIVLQTNKQKVNYFPIYSFHSRQKVWDDKIMKKALSELNGNMKFCQGSFF